MERFPYRYQVILATPMAIRRATTSTAGSESGIAIDGRLNTLLTPLYSAGDWEVLVTATDSYGRDYPGLLELHVNFDNIAPRH